MRTLRGKTFVFVSSRGGPRLHTVERRLLRVMDALLRRGAHVLLVCGPRTELQRQALAAGVEITPYHLDRLNFLRTRSRLRKYLQRHGPSVVHATGTDADLLVRWAARDLPVRVVCSVHCDDVFPSAARLSGRVGRRIDDRTRDRLDAVLVDCAELERRMIAEGYAPEKLIRDAPSVDIAATLAASERAAPELEGIPRPLVGYVGRLSERRGLVVLARAAGILRSRGLVREVVVAGTGRLPALAGQLGTLRRLGRVASAPALLRRLDVCCFPSLEHGVPTTLLEAAALGRPVVASASEGLAELFDDGTEIRLVPAGSEGALAEAVSSLLADPEETQAMAERARMRTVDHYSAVASIDRHLRLYSRIVRE